MEISDQITQIHSPHHTSEPSKTSQTTAPSTNTPPARQPLRVKLGPSTLSRIFATVPSSNSESSPSNDTQTLRAPNSEPLNRIPHNENALGPNSVEPVLLDSSSSITMCAPTTSSESSQSPDTSKLSVHMETDVDDKKKVKVQEEKPNVKRVRQNAPNFAPAYVKNATVKARRMIMIQRAKAKLAKLAETLTTEEADTFGLGRFKTMPIDPKWEDSEEIIMIDGSEPLEEFKQVTKTQLFKTSNQATKHRINQEQEQIERLLMEGVSDDRILTGYFAHQLEALDSKFNAVTEQFTDCTEGLIRTSAEIEFLKHMEVDWESSADKGQEDEEEA